MIRRREFISLLAGAAASPMLAHAQQSERMRRIGVLMNLAANDSEALRRTTALVQGLQRLGWTEGGNVRLDTRWGAGSADLFRPRKTLDEARTDRIGNLYEHDWHSERRLERTYAAELVALKPDVLLAASGATMPSLLPATLLARADEVIE
jgi:putative tryptophan/tyrosine transport system substrate-binding protein